jgi:hypothetical protein
MRGSFGVLRILDSEHMARILYQSMLKPASSADERPALFTREADSSQRSLHAFVRARWRTPQGVKRPQGALAAGIIQGLGWQPGTF